MGSLKYTYCARLLKLLLRMGASPNQGKDEDGRFPLEIAAASSDARLIQSLLEHGANIHRRGNEAWWWFTFKTKPLVFVASDESGKILVKHGRLVSVSWKCRKRILLDSIHRRDGWSWVTAIYILKQYPSLAILRAGYEDWTLIHVAVKLNVRQIVQALLENGVDPSRCCQKDGIRHSPLSLSMGNQSMRIFKLLVAFGAKLNLVRRQRPWNKPIRISLGEELSKARGVGFVYEVIKFLHERNMGLEILAPV